MVEAIVQEIGLQKAYLADATLSSIYFGGGTPSLLDQADLAAIFNAINRHYIIEADAEITLEANPDDLDLNKVKELAASPINRLSIGVQSFFDEDLKWMNRAHAAEEAKKCIQVAQDNGFQNLTIDLIYGAPTTSNENWLKNIATTIELDIPHISCYCLTVEPNTALDHFVKKGTSEPVDEQKAAQQFELLIEQLLAKGYEHYEISNFSKPNCHARHNSNYWLGAPYLGIGPSAHSFDGESRQWNIANNSQYIQAIQNGSLPFEKEILTATQQYNEHILTTLRTKWGCQLSKIGKWGSVYEQYFIKTVQPYIAQDLVLEKAGTFFLTTKGKLFADKIAMELFFEEN